MNTGVVFGQMLVLLAMMAIGFWCYKKKWITEETSGQLSKLVINVFNPVLVVNGVLGQHSSAAGDNIGFNIGFIILYFVILCIAGVLMLLILKPQEGQRNIYRLMTVFSNVGFMGIPVIRSIFGNEAMIYVAFYILAYNIMIYTYGMYLARKSGEEYRSRAVYYLEMFAANDARNEALKKKATGKKKKGNKKVQPEAFSASKEPVEPKSFWQQMINPGVIAALIAVIIFAADITMPEAIYSFCDYMGNTTIPLSMLLIGVSMAQANMREVFTDWRIYVFVALRMVVLPIAMIFLLGGLVRSLSIAPVVFGIFIVELGMPVGSIITLMTREQGGDVVYCTKGVVLSTLASIFTIPFICSFL